MLCVLVATRAATQCPDTGVDGETSFLVDVDHANGFRGAIVRLPGQARLAAAMSLTAGERWKNLLTVQQGHALRRDSLLHAVEPNPTRQNRHAKLVSFRWEHGKVLS